MIKFGFLRLFVFVLFSIRVREGLCSYLEVLGFVSLYVGLCVGYNRRVKN